MSRRTLLKAVLSSLCLGLAGCGKSDSESQKQKEMPKDRLPPGQKKE